NYRVVRLWQEDPESFLTAGIGLVPLAPLINVSEADLPGVVRRMVERINAEPRPRAGKLLTATYLLMGMRYPDELVDQLLQGVQIMRESTTYQKILRDGRVEGEQKLLLLLGTQRFGQPSEAAVAAVEGIRDIDRLE